MTAPDTSAVPAVQTVKRGEVVLFHGSDTWVYPSCGLANVAYVCLACDVELPSRGHMGVHIAAPPTNQNTTAHRIARWCASHGLEAPEERK